MSVLDGIIAALVGLVEGTIALMPTFSMPALPSAGNALGTSLAVANNFFPVVILGGCIVASVAVWVGLVVWDCAVWVYERLPFVG